MTSSRADALHIERLLHAAQEHHQNGRLREAEPLYRQILAKDPNHAEASHLLGLVAHQTGHNEAAIELVRRATQLDPKNPGYLHNLGIILKAAGQHNEAIAAYRQALRFNPDFVPARLSLAHALRAAGRAAEAERHYHHALVRQPELAEGYYGLGIVLADLRRFGEAMRMFRRASELKPDYAEARLGLSRLLRLGDQPAAAAAECEAAINIRRDYPDLHVELSLALLALGRLSRGWDESEWRWHKAAARVRRERYPQAAWKGEPLQGKSILIWEEPDTEDEIRCAGMFAEVIATGASVTIQCAASHLALFRDTFPEADVIARSDTAEGETAMADYQIAAGDLAKFLRPELASFPRREGGDLSGFLAVDAKRVATWRQRLARIGNGLKIGLCWRDGVHAYPSTGVWSLLFGLNGVHFVSLRAQADELEVLNKGGDPVQRFEEAETSGDARDIAGLLRALDLVIAVPGEICALAGGLGVETWQVHDGAAWQRHGLAQNPWYPNMLIRECPLGASAEDCVADIAVDILQRVARPEELAEKLIALGAYGRRRGGPGFAARLFQAALDRDPLRADAMHGLGVIAFQQADYASAEQWFRRGVAADPASAAFHNDLGVVLEELDRSQDAIAEYHAALALSPDAAETMNNLGASLKSLGKIEQAVEKFRQSLKLNPEHPEALHNLGTGLELLGDLDGAIASHREAVRLRPDFLDGRINFAQSLLHKGEFEEGWQQYEHRYAETIRASLRVDVSARVAPWWDGSPLAGKTLLIRGEQGIGDELWLASLYPEVIASAGRVVIECNHKLVALFGASFPKAQVVPRTEPQDPRIVAAQPHFEVAAGSLGRHLRPSLASFPHNQHGYLTGDGARMVFWRQKLAALGTGLKVGFSWRSSNLRGARKLQCSTLDQWQSLFRIPGVHLVNLQYDDCQAELDAAAEACGVKLHRFAEINMFDDLLETASMMTGLDLVITAPTSVAVLAGALGIRTWQLHYGELWQQHGQEKHPWYPDVRTWVRGLDESWDQVLSRVAEELQREASR